MLDLAGRLVPLGWHLQLRGSPVPVVIDHIGRVDASLGLDQPAFRALQALLDSPTFWVKVSGVDRITRQGPPYDDVARCD